MNQAQLTSVTLILAAPNQVCNPLQRAMRQPTTGKPKRAGEMLMKPDSITSWGLSLILEQQDKEIAFMYLSDFL